MKRVYLGTGFMLLLVIALFIFLVSTCNDVHKQNVKEKGEWEFPEYLKTGAASTGGVTTSNRHLQPDLAAVLDSAAFEDTVSLEITQISDSTNNTKAVERENSSKKTSNKKLIAPVITASVGISQPLISISVKPITFASADMGNHPVHTAESDEAKTNPHVHKENKHEKFSETELVIGSKITSEKTSPKLFFQAELINNLFLLTAVGIQKSNLIQPQIGYGFHRGDHLLIPRIGGVFRFDGYKAVSLGFTDQYHHQNHTLFVGAAEYAHALGENESFAFVSFEAYHKVFHGLWLGGGAEILYEHEKLKFFEQTDIELLLGGGLRFYPTKNNHLFFYGQAEYDMVGLLEHGTQLPHHWVVGNFGVVFLLPHQKKKV